MNYQKQGARDLYTGDAVNHGSGPGPDLMGASTLNGNDVFNHRGENLGDIKEIMLDMSSGQVAYAVLSYGGFLGMGEKLFAVPWNALTLDTANKRFTLAIDKEKLKTAPGFDKNDWPDMSDKSWAQTVHDYYGIAPLNGIAPLTGKRLTSPREPEAGGRTRS